MEKPYIQDQRNANLLVQKGHVRLLHYDYSTHEYCRFCVHTIDYDMYADQYILFKYQSDLKLK